MDAKASLQGAALLLASAAEVIDKQAVEVVGRAAGIIEKLDGEGVGEEHDQTLFDAYGEANDIIASITIQVGRLQALADKLKAI
jgi:hypothetical protein